VLLARTSDLSPERREPPVPVALVTLAEQIRPEAASTLAYFAREGVSVKVISGDHPQTVAAVATAVGMRPGDPVDARALTADPDDLAHRLEAGTVFGRVQPRQKFDMVEALQSSGHVVAMTGDGVNDVLALKQADLGVAMGSGSPASRAVAQVVLLDDSFASLPDLLAEGRRVTANIERVASLFVTKSVYAFLLAVAVGVARLPFPFFPRHLTIISSLTIGVPAFFLALEPNVRRHRPGFVRRVARFAVPAGFVAAAATFAGYATSLELDGANRVQERTTALLVLFTVAMWILVMLCRPLTPIRAGLVAALTVAFVPVLALAPLRRFFELQVPPIRVLLAAAAIAAAGIVALEVVSRMTFGPSGPDAASVPSSRDRVA
jgi:magnesium-transporting ATPase (P-type)